MHQTLFKHRTFAQDSSVLYEMTKTTQSLFSEGISHVQYAPLIPYQ